MPRQSEFRKLFDEDCSRYKKKTINFLDILCSVSLKYIYVGRRACLSQCNIGKIFWGDR